MTCEVEEVLPHLPGLAQRMAPPATAIVDVDDLAQEAAVGALQARRTFDPGRGVKFSTYACSRARGAILDSQRSVDHVQRSWRKAEREVTRARSALEQQLGRSPTLPELAEHLGRTTQELVDAERRIAPPVSLQREFTIAYEGDPLTLVDMLEASGPDPVEEAERHEQAAELHAAIDALPFREQLAVSGTFFEGLTLREVGECLGLGESRVSQIRKAAIAHLATALAGRVAA